MKPYVVGIAGGTASGKTTIAQRAAARIGATLLNHDRYYRDAPEPRRFNFDHPDALDTARLVADLDRLRTGAATEVPVYDFALHRRAPAPEALVPASVIVVEGILALADPELRARYDLAVWVEAPADVRLIRRVRRDMAERGRTLESVLDQYVGTVRPMHERHVEPTATYATLRLDGTSDTDTQVARLLAFLADLTP